MALQVCAIHAMCCTSTHTENYDIKKVFSAESLSWGW